ALARRHQEFESPPSVPFAALHRRRHRRGLALATTEATLPRSFPRARAAARRNSKNVLSLLHSLPGVMIMESLPVRSGSGASPPVKAPAQDHSGRADLASSQQRLKSSAG